MRSEGRRTEKMENRDIKEVLISEEQLAAKVAELGARISKD